MLDLTAVAGMIFSLLAMGLIGGFILLYPLVGRLGRYLESRSEASGSDPQLQAQIRRLEAGMGDLQKQLEELAERQSFAESLLSSRDPLLLGEKRPGSE